MVTGGMHRHHYMCLKGVFLPTRMAALRDLFVQLRTRTDGLKDVSEYDGGVPFQIDVHESVTNDLTMP